MKYCTVQCYKLINCREAAEKQTLSNTFSWHILIKRAQYYFEEEIKVSSLPTVADQKTQNAEY